MPFSAAISLQDAVDKSTRNLWSIFADTARSVKNDVESFRKACYEGSSAPLRGNAAVVQNTVQKQSLQSSNVALQEVQSNPTTSLPLPESSVGRANLYKYVRAVQYMLTASAKSTSGATETAILDNYNNILAS